MNKDLFGGAAAAVHMFCCQIGLRLSLIIIYSNNTAYISIGVYLIISRTCWKTNGTAFSFPFAAYDSIIFVEGETVALASVQKIKICATEHGAYFLLECLKLDFFGGGLQSEQKP